MSAKRAGAILLAIAASALTLLSFAPPAQAGKQIDGWLGSTDPSRGSQGGEFGIPADVAVYEATGQIYVADSTFSKVAGEEWSRIQRFNADGSFELAFGRDVIAPGATGDLGDAFEVCVVAADCKGGSFGTEGDGPAGEFNQGEGIAVDQASGDLFVDDGANLRVQQFSFADNGTPADPSDDLPVFERMWGWDVVAEGAPEDTAADAFEVCTVPADCKRGTRGGGPGQFRGPTFPNLDLAVAPPGAPASIAGHVFVVDACSSTSETSNPAAENCRIEEFDPAAAEPADVFVGEFGMPGASGEGQLGTGGPGEFSGGAPNRVAVDTDGIVYASDASDNEHRVQRYDTQSATFLAPIEQEPDGPLLFSDSGSPASPASFGLELDSSTGDLFVLRDPSASFAPTAVQEIDTETLTSLDDTHFTQAGITSNTTGFAANGTSGTLYVAQSSGNPGCHCVFILDDDGAADPEPTVTTVEDMTAHTATAKGTVDSNGGITTYRFEVSTNGGSSWSQIGSDAVVTGDDPKAVSQALTELEANKPGYLVRIVASKPFGGPTVISNEFTFATPAAPPDAAPGELVNRTATTARVSAIVNPNNQPTSYRFEYVDDAEFQASGFADPASVPQPEGDAGSAGQPVSIFETLTGLEPETTYHYRIVATNDEGPSTGLARTFVTRAIAASEKRGFEMVSPPFKVTRSIARAGAPPGDNANPGMPSVHGEAVVWGLYVLPLLPETATGFQGDRVISRRTTDGWVTETLQNLEPAPIETQSLINWAVRELIPSGDLETQAWGLDGTNSNGFTEPTLLETEGTTPNQLYTRRDGTGVKGWTPWLTNVDEQVVAHGLFDASDSNLVQEDVRFNDAGTWMARWGRYRGLLGQDPAEDPSVTQRPGTVGGSTIYLQGNPPSGELDLVNECTGEDGGSDPSTEPTSIPERTVGGTIGAQDCTEAKVTSSRGAIVGSGGGSGALQGSSATALSQDGRRVFFTSPDPTASVPLACAGATGVASDCPPQLFVRQYDANGNPIVRWISRPLIAGQQIGLLGGTAFQGASQDGRFVYFTTKTPLTADDPNGTGTDPGPGGITAGTASEDSWDLYRYELPTDRDEDPDGGTLLRVSGGPDGESDPNTNPSGSAGAARYVSDDGRRAYFVTGAPIAGADASPPTGGVTTPGGAATGSQSTRNLYLFDDSGGAPEWSFVARLPVGGGSGLNACSTTGTAHGQGAGFNAGAPTISGNMNCVRGTVDGGAIAFMTLGRLTPDDRDDVADIYLYDAAADELTRVTSTDSPGFPCARIGGTGGPVENCHGHFGYAGLAGNVVSRGWGGGRNYNMARDEFGLVSVYFDSREPLAPEDANGDNWDVYRWHGGELSLVSRAMPETDSWYSGSSADDEDVFIVTSDRIDPREIDDDDLDIYDVRLGGGFPYTPPPAPCAVLLFECEKAAAPAPPTPSGATTAFVGKGNVVPGKVRRTCGKAKLRRGKRCVGKAALARKRCRKLHDRAKRRCVRKQMRRLTRAQKRQQRKRRANSRAGRSR